MAKWIEGSASRFMMRPMARLMVSSVSVFVLTCALAAAAQEGGPVHAGKAVAAARCGTCHDAGSVPQPPRTRDDWTETIDQMIKDGVQAERPGVPRAVRLPAAEPLAGEREQGTGRTISSVGLDVFFF